MVNIATNEKLMPGFIQGDCEGENLAGIASVYLTDKEVRKKASAALKKAVAKMKSGNDAKASSKSSSERAAQVVLDILK
jgi:lipid A disaccharide synthetase